MQLELIGRPFTGVAAIALLLLGVSVGGCSREAAAPAAAPATPRRQQASLCCAGIGPARGQSRAQCLFRRRARPHQLVVRRVHQWQPHHADGCVRLGPGQGDHQQRRWRQDPDPDAARLLHGGRARRVHGRVQPDEQPREPAQPHRAGQGRHLAGSERSPADVRRGAARHERRQDRPRADRPGTGPLGVVRDREGGRCGLSAGALHDVRRLRMDVQPAAAKPAPRRRVPRHRAPAGHGAVGAGIRRSGDALEMDGRPARTRLDAAGHSTQRQRERRPHVRDRQVRRPADRRRLQPHARGERAAL